MKKVSVIVGVYQGCVEDVRAGSFTMMEEVERQICKDYDVPYDNDKRKEYRDSCCGENDVYHFIVELEDKKVFRQARAGITIHSKRYVEEHIAEIGKVEQVKIRQEDGDYITEIVGSEGVIIVDGFSWGYGGEGPHGLLWLLKDKLGGDVSIGDISKLPASGAGTVWDCREWKPDYRVGLRNTPR
jgi:hypothetical protein